jgi:metal-responsive CopG/Arc/MetJ family transcriptional regulator
MQTITFKLNDEILGRVDKSLSMFNFSTRTEFIRDAIRDKLEQQETENFMKKLAAFKGKAKTKYSDKEFRKLRDKVSEEYGKELEARFK